ncbi:Cytochrome c [Phytophthora infestans]|uniref:Cytochrome c n=1 Tax=Phytophthora infestans TaxID=4787 RepID=A0A833T5L1_PHYIN|nr:Cytochrome c [Phytophthora infestans]KAF4128482.1 Cytochrome c [Phytophthora infestans]KAI9983891.1 hypothetical protein PInf_005164 [Phytophthora infestans]
MVDVADGKGDAARGVLIIKVRCSQCHTTNIGGTHKQGPNLAGIINRKAGEAARYAYSDANKMSGVVWTDETLFEYLLAPRNYIKGTKKVLAGLNEPQDRRDLIAYLMEATNK